MTANTAGTVSPHQIDGLRVAFYNTLAFYNTMDRASIKPTGAAVLVLTRWPSSSTTRRAVAIVVDVPNEDAMFEAIHATWVLARSYPVVSPVMNLDEFPSLLQRAGVS